MAATSRWKIACLRAVSDGVPRRSLTVALVVGTVLNLINQGRRYFRHDVGELGETRFDLLCSLCRLPVRRRLLYAFHPDIPILK